MATHVCGNTEKLIAEIKQSTGHMKFIDKTNQLEKMTFSLMSTP
jgi:hypothetical protein